MLFLCFHNQKGFLDIYKKLKESFKFNVMMPTCKKLNIFNAVNDDDINNIDTDDDGYNEITSRVEESETSENDDSDLIEHAGKKSRKDQLTTNEANHNRLVTKVIIKLEFQIPYILTLFKSLFISF